MEQHESILETIANYKNWPEPKSKDFGEVRDPILFLEVLGITHNEGRVSLSKLNSESTGLSKRLQNLWIVDKPKPTTMKGILSAMKGFNWLVETNPGEYELSKEGLEIYQISSNKHIFRRKLIAKMYERYTTPGWLVSRLIKLNPKDQGLIILPSPLKKWMPDLVPWENYAWTSEYANEVVNSVKKARMVFPGSFPVDDADWVEQVKHNWNQLSSGVRRRVAKIKAGQQVKEKPGVKFFSPRERLTQAMRDASVDLLFSPWSTVNKSYSGFRVLEVGSKLYRLPSRSFRAWCPRLEALELIFYTDYYPSVSGRLIFPCGVFRENAPIPPFEKIEEIKDPEGRFLYLYQPEWETSRVQFVNTLLSVYSTVSRRVGSLYVSLLDVRDELCRILRLSSILFDNYLENAYRESIRGDISILKKISISIESDIRPEQTSAYGLLRRPVYVDNIPESLIAISHVT